MQSKFESPTLLGNQQINRLYILDARVDKRLPINGIVFRHRFLDRLAWLLQKILYHFKPMRQNL